MVIKFSNTLIVAVLVKQKTPMVVSVSYIASAKRGNFEALYLENGSVDQNDIYIIRK